MTYTITLTQEQLQIVAGGLENLPFKIAAPVVGEINKQISEQTKSMQVVQGDE